MAKIRDIHSLDRDGRNVDQFATAFKTIFQEFGHEVNYAYIDYAWDNGLSLEQAAWEALSADRETERYSATDATLALFDKLRRAQPDALPALAEQVPASWLTELPRRVHKSKHWPVAEPPHCGFYRSSGDDWRLVVNVSAAGTVSWLAHTATTPVLHSDPAAHWALRVREEALTYRGACWGRRDDLLDYPLFRRYAGTAAHAAESAADGDEAEWLL